ncbi:hypothetical protein I3900191A7_16210 [Clostridium baratii]|uniref:hypothetical protein n=1 Tax=Clostridium baratii TaxID=1561 RepID=UPI0036F368E7
MLDVQLNIFDDNKIIKRTKDYEIKQFGQVYSIHFIDKQQRDKCRVTKNFEYIKRYL